MNGEQADSVGAVALNGFLVNCLVPNVEERLNVGDVLVEELAELVEESTDVGTLIVETADLEDVEEPFDEFEEWHGEQVVEVVDVVGRQQVVDLREVGKELVVAQGRLQHLPLIELAEGGLTQQVLLIDECVECPHQYVNGIGGIEPEGFA